MKIQITFSLICLLFFTLSTLCKQHKPGPADTCNTVYTAINGTIRAHNKSSTLPKDKQCNWYINFNGSSEEFDENHTIFLIFDEILLGDDDTVTIFADDKPLRFFDGSTLSQFVGFFPILTGKSNITIAVDPTKSKEFTYPKSLQIHYYSNSECNHAFIPSKTAIFQSALYDLEKGTYPIQCSFTFAVPGKGDHYMNAWFEPFEFSQGEISIQGAQDADGNYKSAPSVDLLVKDILQLNVTIYNQTSEPEIVKLKYDSVSKLCSFPFEVSKTSMEKPLMTPDKAALRHILSTQEQSLSCLWLVNAPNPDQTITLTVKDSLNLPQALDSLLVLDGPNRTSEVLLSLTSGQKPNERVVYSSGQHLWISATSPFVTEDFYVELEASLTQTGGHLHGSGDISVNNVKDTIYLLDVKTEQQVKFVINLEATLLSGNSFVNFYDDFLRTSEPFLNLVPGQKPPETVVSPTEKMAIVAENFYSSTLKGSFNGTEKGCYEYGEGSGDTFSVKGNCNNTCAWIVHPVPESKDVLAFHFQMVSLNKTDLVLVRKLDPAQTLVANISFTRSHFPDLWLPAETGTFIQVTRSSCPAENTIIQSSYQTTSGCGNTITPHVNDILEITSPNYPSPYPLGANCTWIVLKPNSSTYLQVSIQDLQLAQEKHSVQIFSGTASVPIFKSNYTNKELPDDMAVFDNLMVTFLTSLDMPHVSLPGFKIKVAVVGRGDVLTSNSGIIETPAFPQPVSDNLLSVWFLRANSTAIQEQILELTFDNRTDLDSIERFLKIYDGSSLRSPIMTNFTNDTVLSRTNGLLFVYQSTLGSAQPGFSIAYQTHACNMSMLCDNNICMHEDWFCNGINDCGDYSDERDCEGRFPSPPTPEPPPRNDVKGASVSVLSGSILAAFILGLLVAIAVPFGYRKWKSRKFFVYDPVQTDS